MIARWYCNVRRRRWITPDGHNKALDRCSLVADGTSYSKEFADVLKKYLDTFPIPARSMERYFKINGRTLEKNYKNHLSGFHDWNQKDHASEWMLLEKNIGENLSLDETMLCRDLITFLSNMDGHGKKGSIIAAVCGTKSEGYLWNSARKYMR